jgi:hypothetical protein
MGVLSAARNKGSGIAATLERSQLDVLKHFKDRLDPVG